MPKPSKPVVERRNVVAEFRVSKEGETPSISGYAALFETKSDDLGYFNEVIDPKAFDTVMANQPDCRALWNHNSDCVLGRTTANTLHLTVDARGLAYVIDPPDTQIARDLIVSMRRKDVTQSSFGFICKRDQWTENPDGTVTRRILEFEELLDVSPVTYPAYSATTSQARSLPASMPKELRSKITKRDAEVTDGADSPDGTDDDLDSDLACACPCAQCRSGACNICSAGDCTDEQCSCFNQRSKSITDSERRRMSMQLALLAKK
jgi:HK97 family phage prohead protease